MNQSDWISVNERLPEVAALVLVSFGEYSTTRVAIFQPHKYDLERWIPQDGNDDFYDNEILAWMALPKGYKKPK